LRPVLEEALLRATQIVPRESSRFGLPGDRENIVKLDADHGDVCRFDTSKHDQDNYELVRGNIKDIYKNALKIGELDRILRPEGQERVEGQDQDLKARFARLKE
jgi:hypothetical protein